jgi:hypothetical protein
MPELSEPLWREQGWPAVQEQETLEEDKLLRKKQAILISLRACDSLLSLMNHPSYKQFSQEVEGMHQIRIATLLAAKNDHELATLKGRCLELRAVTDMVTNTRINREALATQLEEVENQLLSLKPIQPTEEQA